MQADVVEPVVVEGLVADLCREFEVAAEDVRHLVHALYAEFANARVRVFIPVLVERQLRETLRAMRRGRTDLPTVARAG